VISEREGFRNERDMNPYKRVTERVKGSTMQNGPSI
jgi:hypothetical protein